MCVCKQWKSFLSTPMFARMHLHHVTINDVRLDYLYSPLELDREPHYDGLRTIRPKLSPDLSDCYVTASLNGLHGDIWRMDGWVKVAGFNDPQPLLKKMFTRPRIRTMSTGNWLAVLDEENKSLKKMNSEDFTRHYPCFSSPRLGYASSRMIYVETLVSPVNP
ncbi:hypothetical protein Hanom_Chr15g01342961 [Helianthus anomalus]